MLGRGDDDRNEIAEVEVDEERVERPVRIRNQADAHLSRILAPQAFPAQPIDVVIAAEEMPVVGPGLIDLARGQVHALARAAHDFDDAARERDEEIGVVELIGGLEEGHGRGHARLKAVGIDRQTMSEARRLVPDALEARPRTDQREIDVEEDGCRADHWVQL